jgi:ribonuclease HI
MTWIRRRYRGNKAWVRVDADGAPALDERGLAALRYKPDDERTYTVRPDEILPLEADPQEEGAASAGAETATIRAFTDGAARGNPGPAGLGVVLLWGRHRREIHRYLGTATNNEAELHAVLAALEAIKRPGMPLEIHTDSEYVIGALAGDNRVRANAELIGLVRAELERFDTVRFVKVRAHAGIAGNECADALARKAARTRRPR